MTRTSDAPRPTPSSPPGRALLAVAALVAAQGVGLAVLATVFLVELLRSRPSNVAGAIGILVLAALGGLGLLLVARALRDGYRWARAPALVTQLIVMPVALASFPAGWYVGGPLLAWAVAVTVLLFVPSVSDALDD